MSLLVRRTADASCRLVLGFLLGVFIGKSGFAANAIFEALLERGVSVSPQESLKLPKPVLADGLDRTGQRQAIELLLADKYDWESFTRKSVVSPFLLKISDAAGESAQVGRRLDLYFVTYGSLDKLGDEDYLNEQLNLAATSEQERHGASVHVLSGDDLKKRGMAAGQKPGDPRWVAVTSTLLGKVQIRVTTQNVKTDAKNSVLIASITDPRFERDAEFPNCWRAISIDDAGRRQVGPPQPYGGLGSYATATRLIEPAGAIFVEYHVAFAEPQGWFHGANLLRSKLPIVAQDMVRKFRRGTSGP